MNSCFVVIALSSMLTVCANRFASSGSISTLHHLPNNFDDDGGMNDSKQFAGTRHKKPQNQAQKERELDEKMLLSQPSACVWAVLACCAPTNFQFRFGCFPYLGCSALFWQTDPCLLQNVLDATEEAMKFYQQFDKRSKPASPSPPVVTPAVNETVSAANTTTTTTTTTTITSSTVSSTDAQPESTTPTTANAATTQGAAT